MALPSSGSISLSQVNTELGASSTSTRSLNDSTTRSLFGVASGAISMSDGYGKANQFAFTISSNQSNANLATLATNAGWNGSSKVVATIGSGIYISASTTSNVGLTVSGSFPGGVELINNGYIIGDGGDGGAGTIKNGNSGSSGGKALAVSTSVTITNNGTIAGGGGGGGAGGGCASRDDFGQFLSSIGGSGGGGGRSGATNSSGGAGALGGYASKRSGLDGSSGTSSSQGSGGAQVTYGAYGVTLKNGAGGSGGGWGSSGSSGNAATTGSTAYRGTGGAGGGAGACLTGNSYITWAATGTRLGSIS